MIDRRDAVVPAQVAQVTQSQQFQCKNRVNYDCRLSLECKLHWMENRSRNRAFTGATAARKTRSIAAQAPTAFFCDVVAPGNMRKC
jgi:hypothetical protein